MIYLRRARVPASLAGHGPGRPARYACTATIEVNTSSTAISSLSSSSLPPPPPPSSTSPRRPHVRQTYNRQKTPRGTDRPPRTDTFNTDLAAQRASLPGTSRAAELYSKARFDRARAPAVPPLSPVPSASRSSSSKCDTPASVVHSALAVAGPPQPRSILAFVKARPDTYSPQAATALSEYARRANAFDVQRGAYNLLLTERLPRIPMPEILPPPRLVDLVKELMKIGGIPPNTALAKKYRPKLIRDGRDWSALSPSTLLRHYHRLHLANKPLPFEEALNALEVVGASDAELLVVLHLSLAYTSSHPRQVLDAFAQVSDTPWSRQTLHLSILALLRNPTISVAADLSVLVRRFLPLARTPGPESWRHVAHYALTTDDEPLAALAFQGARFELGRERAKAGMGEQRPMRTSTDASPRFLHHGRHVTRWERLLHKIADKGWVTRGPPLPADEETFVPRLIARWEWVGRQGEEVAVERMRVKEEQAAEAVRAAQDEMVAAEEAAAVASAYRDKTVEMFLGERERVSEDTKLKGRKGKKARSNHDDKVKVS